jgi:tRNA modification GTPase
MLEAVKAFKNCLSELSNKEFRLEIAADELRTGLLALESMIGSVDIEDFLDKIFADFCIGK